MMIEQFLTGSHRERVNAGDEAAAVAEVGGLVETRLLAVQVDAVASTAWLLFDCRLALEIRESNTAVLVLHGVDSLEWSTEQRNTSRTSWTVLEWVVRLDADRFRLEAGLLPEGEFRATATSGEFYTGNTPENRGPGPTFRTADEQQMRAGIAGWHSEFVPEQRFVFGPGDGG